MSKWLPIVAGTAVLTVGAVVLALNFTTGEKKIEQRIERLYGVEAPDFVRSMGVLLGPAILAGNGFEELLNGDRIFPAMLDAIRGARKSVTFESYIYWSGTVGQKFADALAERALAGVKVHVLLDWLGSGRMEEALLEKMRASGVKIEKARANLRIERRVLREPGFARLPGGLAGLGGQQLSKALIGRAR